MAATSKVIARRSHGMFSLSLRGLLFIVTLVCVALGIWIERGNRQARIVQSIRDHGGEVYYQPIYANQMVVPREERFQGRAWWQWPSPDHYLTPTTILMDENPPPEALEFALGQSTLIELRLPMDMPLERHVLARVGQMTMLEHFHGNFDGVTDEDILLLSELKGLRWLLPGQCHHKITHDGFIALGRELPNTRINTRANAYIYQNQFLFESQM